MNIALSTIVLFFLLIPGILFRRFYYSEEFSREYFKSTFFEVFISTILPSLILQLIWYIFAKLICQHVDLNILADLVSAKPSEETFLNIQNNSVKIIVYNISLFTFSSVTGFYCKQIVRKYKWDRRYKYLRYQNSWHYILKGEFFDFPRADISLEKDEVEDIEFVFVDVIVQIGGESYLYDGLLVDYELSKDGGLETLSIKNAQRRKLSHDSEIGKEREKSDNSSNYYPIMGHILLLKYSEMKNLNFSYYRLDQTADVLRPRMVE
ncbi:hypothetical protein [Maribacter polysaccharolyticus]|uniref:hypothetical protein n=1 Tax=Maribacter polysaccharolyticus TaxID=3020831 RepID=UPI00237F35D1|nr:hypothetical protein [Maribacter polysaccharolyticus]MDE3743999.1 hypothetical protein [Maribacter polysaccharolyticus]